jgi:hypothetical protein
MEQASFTRLAPDISHDFAVSRGVNGRDGQPQSDVFTSLYAIISSKRAIFATSRKRQHPDDEGL